MVVNNKTNSNNSNSWIIALVICSTLIILAVLPIIGLSMLIGTEDVSFSGNTAKIKISGPIMTESPGGFMDPGVASSTEIVRLIQEASEDDSIKAILLEINSGGGTVVATKEIARELQKTNKTKVAWIREVGASGAYWIATETDYIIADEMTITGSIGVIASYIEIGGLLNKYNASYQRLVSGNHKDMGTPFRKLTVTEEEIMQDNLDLIRGYFVDTVAKNRKLSTKDAEEIADGRYYLGIQAKELGLVDAMGGMDTAINYIEKQIEEEVEIIEYSTPATFLEILTSASTDFSYNIGRGMGNSIVAEQDNNRMQMRI